MKHPPNNENHLCDRYPIVAPSAGKEEMAPDFAPSPYRGSLQNPIAVNRAGILDWLAVSGPAR
jgi:hypothetical protein